MTELIYWSHKLPHRIEVVEISGGEGASATLWKALALQLIAEHSADGYRQIDHYRSGAPFFAEEEQIRISVTHTGNFMAVAMLPPAPEALPDSFVAGYALGIDAERKDREQVLRIRDRFLSDTEKEFIAADDVEANILAWTVKEAAYKAMLTPGLDFRRDIIIISLPETASRRKGEAICKLAETEVRLTLCSWESEGHILTIAYA